MKTKITIEHSKDPKDQFIRKNDEYTPSMFLQMALGLAVEPFDEDYVTESSITIAGYKISVEYAEE